MRDVLRVSFWFCLGFFTSSLYWVSLAMSVDLTKFWWLVPLTLFGIPAAFCLFVLVGVFLAKSIAQKFKLSLWQFTFLFAASWVFFEYLRGLIFPWAHVGYFFLSSLALSQVAVFCGVYGLTLLFFVATLGLNYFWMKHFVIAKKMFVFLVVVTSFLFLWGQHRIKNVPQDTTIFMRAVQPNISQQHKWDPAFAALNLSKLLRISLTPSNHPLQAILWPEAALQGFLNEREDLREQIAKQLPSNATLILGGGRIEREPNLNVFNSLYMLSSSGEILASYDKATLVPFGEYLPFRNQLRQIPLLKHIGKITQGSVDFSCGDGLKTIVHDKLGAFSPLICFEVLFSGHVCSTQRPDWILNLTNDAWFGDTSGPRQHLAISRMRAIEEGLPLVRVANTGISAVIDAVGQQKMTTILNREVVFDFFLPQKMDKTLFAIYGLKIVWFLCFCLVFLVFASMIPRFLKIR